MKTTNGLRDWVGGDFERWEQRSAARPKGLAVQFDRWGQQLLAAIQRSGVSDIEHARCGPMLSLDDAPRALSFQHYHKFIVTLLREGDFLTAAGEMSGDVSVKRSTTR
ncbi:hypothetical protein FHS27_005298 [Rhodopirellula rubra]|uniref:Uncharacterized protein n=1 Tax=Aporhodopirellula rubra TaxID=980271 RepID=A0A7W5E4I1_9BACT|nr:hypothetical protein [Aporhodopirellula rubra]MBB3209458.1 hypothetical protein [Aporhodopirellula rubra]